MKKPLVVLAVLVVVAVLAFAIARCVRDSGPTLSNGLSPEQATEARRQVVRWLDCEDCIDGELDAVVRLGATVVPTLNAILEKGLSDANRERMRLHLVESRERAVTYWREHGGREPPGENEFVQPFLDNYDARHRIRAATALGSIGGPEARKSLEAARGRDDLRYDVREAVDLALRQTAGATAD
jgi:HEAT repeat protein